MANLKLESTPNHSFELPAGAIQVGTIGVCEGGRMVIIVDPDFVRVFDVKELDGVIACIAEYLRTLHGQGRNQ